MAEPTQPADSASEVRPQRPRAALAQPASADPPNAWQNNAHGTAMLFLVVALVFYVGLCAAFSGLTTGVYLLPTLSKGVQAAPLGQFLLSPISIYQVPMQAVVMACLLAGLMIGPLLIGQFYGRGWSLLFLVPLVVLAHLPLLTVAMLLAVLLATVRKLGIVNRFVRGLVALALPVAALWVSTACTDNGFKSPMAGLYLHGPWIAAVVITILAAMIFWLLVRFTGYRAGFVAVIIGLILAVAQSVFTYGVGGDELAYHLLEQKCGLDSTNYFRCGSIKGELDFLTDQAIAQGGDPNPDRAGVRASQRQSLAMQRDVQLRRSREVINHVCRDFLLRYENSRYVPWVRFLLARSMDMRLDVPAVSRDEKVVYYEDFPSEAGQEVWQQVLFWRSGPLPVGQEHALAVLARVRLGQAELARGHIEQGLQGLIESRKLAQAASRPEAVDQLFGIQPREADPWPIIDERMTDVPFWIWLVEKNRGQQNAGDVALAEFFRLDPRGGDYDMAMAAMATKYRTSPLSDNLDLMLLLRRKMSEGDRIDALARFINARPAGNDARLHAMSELASLLMKQESTLHRDEARRLWRALLNSKEPLFEERARRGLISVGEIELSPIAPTFPTTQKTE